MKFFKQHSEIIWGIMNICVGLGVVVACCVYVFNVEMPTAFDLGDRFWHGAGFGALLIFVTMAGSDIAKGIRQIKRGLYGR